MGSFEATHNDSVIPSKDCKFIQSSNQIPPSGDISGYEDTKGEDREGVHESAAIAGALLFEILAHLKDGGRDTEVMVPPTQCG